MPQVESRMRASPWLWNFRRLVLLRMSKERISVRLRSLNLGQLPHACYQTNAVCADEHNVANGLVAG